MLSDVILKANYTLKRISHIIKIKSIVGLDKKETKILAIIDISLFCVMKI